MELEERRIDRHGSAIRLWVSGDPAGRPVVLTHGAALDHHSFDAQIDALTEAGYRVVTWDLRGHGRSQPSGERFSLTVATDDLAAVMDVADVQCAALVGHSFGGYIVQQLTAKTPDRVHALAVIGCTDLSARPSWLLATLAKLAPRRVARMPVEQLRAQSVRALSIKPEVTAKALQATKALSRDTYVEVIMAGLECLTNDSGLGQDYRIPCPTLIACGESDKANGGMMPKAAKPWASRQPNARHVAIPHAGHSAHQDNPVSFNAALLDFLDRSAPAPAPPPTPA